MDRRQFLKAAVASALATMAPPLPVLPALARGSWRYIETIGIDIGQPGSDLTTVVRMRKCMDTGRMEVLDITTDVETYVREWTQKYCDGVVFSLPAAEPTRFVDWRDHGKRFSVVSNGDGSWTTIKDMPAM